MRTSKRKVSVEETLGSRHLSQKSHKKTIAKYNKLCYKKQYITKVKY